MTAPLMTIRALVQRLSARHVPPSLDEQFSAGYYAGRDDAAKEVAAVLATLEQLPKSEPERIMIRCPSCGHQTLFIGSGGYLTCSWLDCKAPSVWHFVADLQSQLAQARAENERWGRLGKLEKFIEVCAALRVPPSGSLDDRIAELLQAEAALLEARQTIQQERRKHQQAETILAATEQRRREAVAAKDTAQQASDTLRAALRQYGVHTNDCSYRCTCGLAALLAASPSSQSTK